MNNRTAFFVLMACTEMDFSEEQERLIRSVVPQRQSPSARRQKLEKAEAKRERRRQRNLRNSG